eukprot:1435291-Alexandrium_andersonii.AAC.1
MPVSTAIRLNPQAAMRNTQHRFRRGAKKGLGIGPRSSRAVRSAQFLAQIPNLPSKAGLEG